LKAKLIIYIDFYFLLSGDSGGPAVIEESKCPTATLLGISRYAYIAIVNGTRYCNVC
jgi:hypothetical protein